MSLFSSLSVESSNAKPAVASGEKKVSRVFQPGQYEIQITNVFEPRPSMRDSSWMEYLIQYTDANGERNGSMKLLVPTQSLTFTGDDKGVNEIRVRTFLRALGMKASNESLISDLTATFGNPEKGLVGKRLTVKLDYNAHHCGWDRENRRVLLLDRNKNVVKDAQGVNLSFESNAEAEAYALRAKLYFRNFVDVAAFIAAELPAAEKKVAKFGKK